MNNTSVWAMVMSYLNLSGTGSPDWSSMNLGTVIIAVCLCALIGILIFVTYDLISDLRKEDRDRERKEE